MIALIKTQFHVSLYTLRSVMPRNIYCILSKHTCAIMVFYIKLLVLTHHIKTVLQKKKKKIDILEIIRVLLIQLHVHVPI